MILWKLDFYLKRQRTGLKWKNWVIMCCYCYRSYCSNDTPLNKIRPSFHPTLEGKLFSNSILCFFSFFEERNLRLKGRPTFGPEERCETFVNKFKQMFLEQGTKWAFQICSNIRRNKVNSWQQGTRVSKQGTKCWIIKECYCALWKNTSM